MNVPSIYSVFKGGEIRSAKASFDGFKISFASEPVRTIYAFDELDERSPVVIIDVNGINKRDLDDKMITNIKVPGGDVWFLTFIDSIEDVFDCFMGNISKVLIPYHTLRDSHVMKEAFEVSDNCIPVLFVSEGRVMGRNGQSGEIRAVLKEMTAIGFPEVVVFDSDNMMTDYDWTAILERYSGVIPYVKDRDPEHYSALGYKTVIYDTD